MTVIRALVADRVRIPFRRPFATASGMWLERDAWLIRLVDADGRIGLGEAVLDPANGEVAETILAALVREAADDAAGGLPTRDDLELHGAPGRALNAAIESARLDLDRAAAPPAIALDGEGVGVNATIPSLGPAAAAEAAQQLVEAGFTTLKLKAGAERETEVLVDRVRAIRLAVGPDIRLRLDVNGAWDLATAEDRLEAIARFDDRIRRAAAAGRTTSRRWPIFAAACGSRSQPTKRPSPFALSASLLAADAVDVIVVKPARVGGPAAVGEIAEMAARARCPGRHQHAVRDRGRDRRGAIDGGSGLPEVGGSAWPEPPDHGLATAGLLEHDLLADSLHGRRTGGCTRRVVPATGGLGIVAGSSGPSIDSGSRRWVAVA